MVSRDCLEWLKFARMDIDAAQDLFSKQKQVIFTFAVNTAKFKNVFLLQLIICMPQGTWEKTLQAQVLILKFTLSQEQELMSAEKTPLS